MAKSDNWSTPPDLMTMLDQEFKFDLEVCAAKDNRALPDVEYMGLDNGRDALGFENSWDKFGNRAYINPPYSELPAFVEGACANHHEMSIIVMLIPAYTETNYWWDYIHGIADEVRFIRRRLKFWDKGKPGKDTARFPSALVVYRRKPFGTFSPDYTIYRAWDWTNY